MERKVLLAFRGIVDSLFKGKDVFVMGGYLLEKEHLMFWNVYIGFIPI